MLPVRQGLSTRRVLVLGLGLPLTVVTVAAACLLLEPGTLVQTRIVADDAGPAGRAVLAEAALHLQAAPGQSVLLQDHGNALVVAQAGADGALVRERMRTVTDALLDLPQTGLVRRVAGMPQEAPDQDSPAARTRAAMAERARLQAVVDAIATRLASASASLTGVTRDLAAAGRAASDRRPGRETLDKAAVALADLQLQRIQMQSRYQDDYPAVVALDGQIRSMRNFLQDEGRRVDTTRAAGATDPALGSERDRLRAELAQLTDRQAVAEAELAGSTRMLPSKPPDRPVAEPKPAVPHAGPPEPVLLEAATTVVAGPDYRWAAAPGLTALGLALALIAWFKPSRQSRALPAELLLQRLEALLLPNGGAAPDLDTSGYHALALARLAQSQPLQPQLAEMRAAHTASAARD